MLWVFTVWTAGNIVAMFTGVPSLLAPAAGLLAGLAVWWDPRGQLWGHRAADAQLRRRRVADLPRVAESRPEGELRREADTAQG